MRTRSPTSAARRADETPRERCAFTVLELIVVLVMVGALATMAVPRYANIIARQRIDAAARRIAVDLALAQRRARFSSAPLKINFNLTADHYVLVGVQHPDHPAREYVVSLADEPYEAEIVSADLGGDAEIIFDGYGVPDSGGTIVVQSGSLQKTITIDAQTGEAVISDGPPAQPPQPPQQQF